MLKIQSNVDLRQEKLRKTARRKRHWLRNPKTWLLIIQIGRILFWIIKKLKVIAEDFGWM
jgi:hypothetical protein